MSGSAVPAPGGPARLPISVCLRTIRAEPAWWLESARRLDAAGYEGLWAWDHFTGQGDHTVPVVENWTILSMAAALTDACDGRPVRPQRDEPPPGGRGTHGLDPPDRERRSARPRHRHRWRAQGARRLRHRLPGGARARGQARRGRGGHPRAVDRRPGDADSPFYPLRDASAYPIPDPLPRIIVGGETIAGARLAGRIGDGWSAFDDNFEANLPAYLESLEASGRRREDQRVIVGFQGFWLSDEPLAGSPVAQRAARDLGPLARGRRGRRDPAGADDGRRRRPGRGRRALVGRRSPGRPVARGSWHHH